MDVILTLDAALAGCSVGLVSGGRVIAERGDAQGQAQALPLLARAVLEALPAPSALAVTVGPGSFTGLRASLALAHGIALGRGLPILGVTVGEAIAAGLVPEQKNLWVAVDTRRGRIFLDRGGAIESFDLAALPLPEGPVAVAGDAADAVAASLRARGADARTLEARAPTPLGIARAARRRLEQGLPPRPAQPLYIDAPEARPGPRGRPAPA